MIAILSHWPWLIAMGILTACSAFFSGSEAALFCLRWPDRAVMAIGSRSQRAAEQLLQAPDRLLSAVLFWNLLINTAYFSMASVVALAFDRPDSRQPALTILFPCIALLSIIVLGEMFPKSVAVMRPQAFAGVVGLPLVVAVRLVDPLMPWLQSINRASQRVLWPSVEQEPLLDVADIERAIELAQPNDALAAQEEMVLRNLVELSELEVQELMRPRNQIRAMSPPVARDDLLASASESDVLFLTEYDSDEIVSAVSLWDLPMIPVKHVERLAKDVLYVPWCATVADAFEQMHRHDNPVCVVVNELGETLGTITMHDVLDSVFSPHHHRSDRLLRRTAVQQIAPSLWRISGMTNLRRLTRLFRVDFPESPNVTIGGVVFEVLERSPEIGDCLRWGPLAIRVIRAGAPADLLLEVQLTQSDNDDGT